MDESDDIQGPRPVPSLRNLAVLVVVDENLKLSTETFILRNVMMKLLLRLLKLFKLLPKKSRDEINETEIFDGFSAILNTQLPSSFSVPSHTQGDLPLYRCHQSCGRDNFFALNFDICPRRALVDIYVEKSLRLLKKSLTIARVWNDTHNAIFDEIRATCLRLPCCGFLPMVEDKELVEIVHEAEMIDPSRQSFYDALKKGKEKLGENGCGILVYTYKYWRDGRHLTHCVEMQFDKHSEVEKIDFIDNQSQKHLTWDRFPESYLLKIQVLKILKNIRNIQPNWAMYLCSAEDGGRNTKVNIRNILKNHFREKSEERKSRGRSATI